MFSGLQLYIDPSIRMYTYFIGDNIIIYVLFNKRVWEYKNRKCYTKGTLQIIKCSTAKAHTNIPIKI